MRFRFASAALAAAIVMGCLAPFGCSSSNDAIAPGVDASAVDAPATKAPPIDVTPPRPDAARPGWPCYEQPDLSSLTPTWKAPSPFGQTSCSPAQVEAILSCYLDPNADPTFCSAVNADKTNQPCGDCLITPDTAKALGPIVVHGTVGSVNQSGCLANASGDTTSNGCGAHLEALGDCLSAACYQSLTEIGPCPDSGFLDYKTCPDTARRTVCATYAAAASCADALLAVDGGAHDCAVGDASTLVADAIRIGKLFCAGKPDGGASDAATD